MILSKMLGLIVQNPDLLEDKGFTELVMAAWEDFKSLFDELCDGELDCSNGLFGWATVVRESLSATHDHVDRLFPTTRRSSITTTWMATALLVERFQDDPVLFSATWRSASGWSATSSRTARLPVDLSTMPAGSYRPYSKESVVRSMLLTTDCAPFQSTTGRRPHRRIADSNHARSDSLPAPTGSAARSCRTRSRQRSCRT
jgi:hypothetical protein